MSIKQIREIMSDEDITAFINKHHQTSHIEIHDDAVIAWGDDNLVSFASFTENCELTEQAVKMRRENNLKIILGDD